MIDFKPQKVNAIFGSTTILSKEISNIKNGEPIPMNQCSDIFTQMRLPCRFDKAPL